MLKESVEVGDIVHVTSGWIKQKPFQAEVIRKHDKQALVLGDTIIKYYPYDKLSLVRRPGGDELLKAVREFVEDVDKGTVDLRTFLDSVRDLI